MNEETKHLLGFGQRQLGCLKGDICKAEKYNFDVLLFPCKFSTIFARNVIKEKKDRIDVGDIVDALKEIFGDNEKLNEKDILYKMKKSNKDLYFQVHTEQDHTGSNGEIPTQINSRWKPEREKTMTLLKGVIKYFGELNKDDENLKERIKFIEVHSSHKWMGVVIENGKEMRDTDFLSKNLQSLSDECREYNLRLGIEYGKTNTCFTGNNIEKVMDKLRNDVDFVYDLSLASLDAHKNKFNTIEKLEEYAKKYRITQVHWNNIAFDEGGGHYTLFDERGSIKEDKKKKDISSVIQKLFEHSKDRDFVHILEHSKKPFCKKYGGGICKEIRFIRRHDKLLKPTRCIFNKDKSC